MINKTEINRVVCFNNSHIIYTHKLSLIILLPILTLRLEEENERLTLSRASTERYVTLTNLSFSFSFSLSIILFQVHEVKLSQIALVYIYTSFRITWPNIADNTFTWEPYVKFVCIDSINCKKKNLRSNDKERTAKKKWTSFFLLNIIYIFEILFLLLIIRHDTH
jgi:hypothetical protein